MNSSATSSLVPSQPILEIAAAALPWGWQRAADLLHVWTGRLAIVLGVQQATPAEWLHDAVPAQGEIADGISIASHPRRWAATVESRIQQKAAL